KSGFDWISGERHNNWNFARRLLRGLCGRREPGHDQIDIETHQLRGQFGKAAYLSLIRPELVANVLPLVVTQLLHRFAKQPPEFLRTGSPNHQRADSRHLSLLGHAGQRPESRGTAEKPEEIAPPHSISS